MSRAIATDAHGLLFLQTRKGFCLLTPLRNRRDNDRFIRLSNNCIYLFCERPQTDGNHTMLAFRIQAAIRCFVITAAVVAASSTSNPRGTILVVGATGSTGLRAIQGLLDVGYKPRQLRLLTRNASSSKCKALKKAGFGIVEADLEDDALQTKGVTKGCVGCYIHSTSSDTAELDKGELLRAEKLALVIRNEKNTIRHVVYNSAAAQNNHGVGRIAQKHDVENVFEGAVHERNASKNKIVTLSFTALRANIFMEELWKHYTRPQILQGVYPLPVPSSRKIYLVSVRDLGRLAGRGDHGPLRAGPGVRPPTHRRRADHLAGSVLFPLARCRGARREKFRLE